MGLIGLSNTLAIEGAKNNIHSNVIIPTAASRMTKDILPDFIYNELSKLFGGRFMLKLKLKKKMKSQNRNSLLLLWCTCVMNRILATVMLLSVQLDGLER